MLLDRDLVPGILGGSIIISSKLKVQNAKFLSDPVELRLRRIEGQITGIRKMYMGGRDCLEIAQQIAAVRSALASVGREIVSGEAIRCAWSRSRKKEFAKMIEELFVMR